MGDLTGQNNKQIDTIVPLGRTRQQIASVDVGSWLWRQGSGSLESGGMDVPTAWWINFGTYVAGPVDLQRDEYNSWLYGNAPFLTGFTGVGTLGGGNLVVESGGDAGMIQIRGDVVLNGEGQRAAALRQTPRSQGVHLAVGSTGRVQADGSLVQTGGGDLDIRIGGTLNPNPQLRSNDHDLNSTFVNLRGRYVWRRAMWAASSCATAGWTRWTPVAAIPIPPAACLPVADRCSCWAMPRRAWIRGATWCWAAWLTRDALACTAARRSPIWERVIRARAGAGSRSGRRALR